MLSARSGTLNTPLSAFASLINTGSTIASGCFMAIQSGRSEGFGYQETDAQNQPVGAPETPVNIGAGGSLSAWVDDAQTGLAVQPFICKTNAQGACENDPATQVDFSLATDEVALFSVFVAGQGNIPFDAANHRLFLRLEQQDVQRGATSVAVRTVTP